MITTKTQTRLFHWLARTLAVLCVFILMLFIWAKYFEVPYLTFQNLPFPVLAKAYPGRVVPLAIERCNLSHWKRTYVTTHNIINEKTGMSETLPDVLVDIAPGCTRDTSLVNVVPITTAPGIYTLSGVALIDGLFEIRRIEWYSKPFEVLPKEQDPEGIVVGPPGPPGPPGKDGPPGVKGPPGPPSVPIVKIVPLVPSASGDKKVPVPAHPPHEPASLYKGH